MKSDTHITPEACRAARAILGMTQADLAKLSGVAEPTIRDFEASRRRPRAQTAARLADALDVAGLEERGYSLRGLTAPAEIVLRPEGADAEFLDELLSSARAALEIVVGLVADIQVSDVVPRDLGRERLLNDLDLEVVSILADMERAVADRLAALSPSTPASAPSA